MYDLISIKNGALKYENFKIKMKNGEKLTKIFADFGGHCGFPSLKRRFCVNQKRRTPKKREKITEKLVKMTRNSNFLGKNLEKLQ